MPPGPCDPAYQAGFQEGLKACEKEVVGGTAEPIEISEIRATEQPYSSDSGNLHIYVALGVGLAAVIAIGGGFLALRRRRAH